MTDLDRFEGYLVHPEFSHVSWRPWCGVVMLYAYRRDTTSPSGVVLLGGIQESQEVADLMNKHGKGAQMGGQMGEMACRRGMTGR